MLASCPALPYTWGKFSLPEHSKILILTTSVKLKDKNMFSKKGTHWHGQGFKIGLIENLPNFSEIQENIFFTDKHTYFVTYTHTIQLLYTPF